MVGMRRILTGLLLVAVAALATACGESEPATTTPEPGAVRQSAPPATPTRSAPAGVTISIQGNPALLWGNGSYGVVLAHGRSYDAASWTAQAPKIAAQGATVIAVESIEPAAILDAVAKLQSDGIKRVALMGGSAGADAILQVARRQPDLADQLILLSPNQFVTGLGSQPKLFIASAEERNVDVSGDLATRSPGSANKVTIVPGKSHAQAILRKDKSGAVLRLILERLRQ